MPERVEMGLEGPRMPQDETRGAGPRERPTRRRKSERADQTGARSGGAETRPLCRLGYTLSASTGRDGGSGIVMSPLGGPVP